jgi:magnesium transporter
MWLGWMWWRPINRWWTGWSRTWAGTPSSRSTIRWLASGPVFTPWTGICDPYFLVAESLEEAMEDQLEAIESGALNEAPAELRQLRLAISKYRRSVTPLRDVIAGIIKSESSLLSKPSQHWFRELHQQSQLLVETSEQLMGQLADVQSQFQVAQNDRLNSTMRLLTIVATFFIPLTFLVGVYGMNFDHMPETKWTYGYPMFWGVCVVMAVGMAVAFRRRGWF